MIITPYKSEDLIHKKFIELICDSIYIRICRLISLQHIQNLHCLPLRLCCSSGRSTLYLLGVEDLILSLSLSLSLSHYLCFVFILLTYMLMHDKHNQSFSYRNPAKFTIIFFLNGNLFANLKIIFLYSQLAKQLDTLSNCLSTCLSHRQFNIIINQTWLATKIGELRHHLVQYWMALVTLVLGTVGRFQIVFQPTKILIGNHTPIHVASVCVHDLKKFMSFFQEFRNVP